MLSEVNSVKSAKRSQIYGSHYHHRHHPGSISSVVHSEDDYSGSYNWDYLLDWGPQYQPLAHVFKELSKFKDDSNMSRPQTELSSVSARQNHPFTSGNPLPVSLPSFVSPHHPNAMTGTTPDLLNPRSSQFHNTENSDVNSSSPQVMPNFNPSLSIMEAKSPEDLAIQRNFLHEQRL